MVPTSGNGRPRVLYICHESATPSGGVRTLYAHVQHLRRHGFPAFIVYHNSPFKPNWLDQSAPTLYLNTGLDLQPTDIIVVPEDYPGILDAVRPPIKKVVFCQNHFYVFNALPAGRSWRDLGVSRVVASSEIIADFVRTNLGWPHVPVVHYAIDHRIFKPGPKKLQIAYMPRKATGEPSFIRGLLSARGGLPAQVPWIEIEQMAESRVAEILAESTIFISFSRLEGFGLPPIEAMACGATVVGYHGHGGLAYATRNNGFWCEEANPVALATVLRDVIDMHVRRDPKLMAIFEAGIRTAAEYTSQRQETELLQVVRDLATVP